MGTHFCYKIVHCEIFVQCIMGFVRWFITWTNDDKDSSYHMASLGRSELTTPSLNQDFIKQRILMKRLKIFETDDLHWNLSNGTSFWQNTDDPFNRPLCVLAGQQGQNNAYMFYELYASIRHNHKNLDMEH